MPKTAKKKRKNYVRLRFPDGSEHKLVMVSTEVERPKLQVVDHDGVPCNETAWVHAGRIIRDRDLTKKLVDDDGTVWAKDELRRVSKVDGGPPKKTEGTRTKTQDLEPSTFEEMLEHAPSSSVASYDIGAAPDTWPADKPYVSDYAYRKGSRLANGFVFVREGRLILMPAVPHGFECVARETPPFYGFPIGFGEARVVWRDSGATKPTSELRTPAGMRVSTVKYMDNGKPVPRDATRIQLRETDLLPATAKRLVRREVGADGHETWVKHDQEPRSIGKDDPLCLGAAEDAITPRELFGTQKILAVRQVAHADRDSFDWLFALASGLGASGKLRPVTAAGGGPLLLSDGGPRYRGWVSGKVDGDRYRLTVHMVEG